MRQPNHAAVPRGPWLWATAALLCLGAAACSSGTSGTHHDAGQQTSDADSGQPTMPDGGSMGMPDAGSSDGGDVDGGGDGGVAGPPTITSVTPPRGPVAGGSNIVLFGTGFVYGFADEGGPDVNIKTQVMFGTQQVNINGGVNVIDDQTMEVVAPPGVRGTVDISLTNPNGSVVCHGCFTYVEDIQVSRVSPTFGPTSGGQPLTITGKGFADGMLVLVGGSEGQNVTVSPDGTQITLLTPPGKAGSADVGVVATDADVFLHRSYVYVAPVAVTSVSPPASPLAGGGMVTITGSGFTADAKATFGGQTASVTFVSDTQLKATVPPAMGAGAVDVTVTTNRSSGTLAHGFSYFDSELDPQVLAVYPAQGPVAGGTTVEIVGTGFNDSMLDVKFGANDAAVVSHDDNTIFVTVPPAAGPGLVDVQVRTSRGGTMLGQGFGYVIPLTVSSITPASAPSTAMPPETATLQGTGFDPSCVVTIGSAAATVQGTPTGDTSLVVAVPAGPAGPRDVTVACGTLGSPMFQQAILVGAFTYTTPLQLLKVDPESGAIAGNTAVSVYGSGFEPGMQVLFGDAKAPVVDVQSPHLAVVRTPRGNVGFVDVTVNTATDQATLKSAFGYVNPANILGGGSGGPMRGILNVTVLNSTPGLSGPVPGVTISINADQLTGVTDDRGQVTFSDPSLLKPVTITGSKPMFATASIAHIDARNVTLFMQLNMGNGTPSPGGPPPAPATFTGRVCGFKTEPGMTLGRGQRLEAHVYMSAPYVYAAPPFAQLPTPVVVTSDCGVYQISTRRFGPLALWAEFGITDTTTTPASFTPLIMGIRRSLDASPGKAVANLDIILDMHRDVTFPVTVDETQLGLAGGVTIMNDVFSYLDLGGEGVIPLAEARSTNSIFPFDHHPRVDGEGLVFLNMAAEADSTGNVTPPYSLYYRRQYGDLAAGVTIGPMLSFPKWLMPGPTDVFTGTLSWTFLGGLSPDIQQLEVDQPMGFGSVPIWSVVLPGQDQSVTIPPSATSSVPAGQTLTWTLITAKSPRLDYDQFSFQQLGVNDWTSFTEDFGSFTTAP